MYNCVLVGNCVWKDMYAYTYVLSWKKSLGASFSSHLFDVGWSLILFVLLCMFNMRGS